MKFKRIEFHTVHSYFTYEMDDQEIIETWGSLERFRQIVSHMNHSDDWDAEPFGEPPTAEEEDLFHEFIDDHSYDREDDWFSDRKGGYDITYEIVDDEDIVDYDSDEEVLH